MPVKLSKWCKVNVFILTVCSPSAPAVGDNFDDKSLREKSIPNLLTSKKIYDFVSQHIVLQSFPA